MKISDIKGTVQLHNGIHMPYLGLGVFEAEEGKEAIDAIHWALEAGYRHIDTASMYMNERSVGEAIRTSSVKRDEIFVTTKLWNSDQGYQQTHDAFYQSLEKLDTGYVDLYLIHWPVTDKYLETWEAMEELYEKKLVKAIGVSNFNQHHLEDIINRKGRIPVVNQVEFHPWLQQPDLRKFCQQHHIQYQAWSPIIKGQVNEIETLVDIGKKHSKSAVQVTLRWELQKGVVTIPKSVHKERIISNAAIFDFELSEDEVQAIDALNRNYRTGPDPESF